MIEQSIYFTKIHGLHNIRKSRFVQNLEGPVDYVGTVKLHGTNGGVRINEAESIFEPLSRKRVLSLESDNAGFCSFCMARRNTLERISRAVLDYSRLSSLTTVTLFGEWIGPGIQKGVAINKLPTRQFVLFGAKVDDTRYVPVPRYARAPDTDIYNIADVSFADVTIDFSNSNSLSSAVTYINEVTDDIDKKCPWAAQFGIEGHGEGLVWTPLGEHAGNSNLYFKSKGERHKVNGDKVVGVKLDPDTLKSMNEFVEFACTENRLLQGLENIESLDMKSTGQFLSWVCADIVTECNDELVANGFVWKSISKFVNNKAVAWFKDKVASL